jgi:ABC-2 type transport system permease protein
MINKILAITWKDALLRFSSKSEWLFFLILPIIFTVILSGGTPQNGDNRVRLVVVDQAASPLSQELIAALDQSDTVRPDVLSLREADAELSQRRTSAVLVIPAEFTLQGLAASQIELELRQRPNSTNAMVAERAVQAVTGRISSGVDIAASSAAEAERLRPFESNAARQAYIDEARQSAEKMMAEAPDRLLIAEAETADTVDWDPRANSSAGQLITWVFIPLIGLSGSFAFERQKGTLRRVLTSPTRKATFLFGTIFGQIVLALVQMLLLIGFGMLVLKLNWGRDPLALILILMASALAASALGTALGTFVKTEGQASGLSIMLGMVMALLGGCWYPLEMFPQFIQQTVRVLPTTWAMQGMLDLVLRGQGLAAVLPEAGVLVGFAALFFTIGILRFKYE